MTSTQTDELVDLLDSLVSLPTIAGTPNRDLIDYVRARLVAHGVESTVLPSSSRPDGYNLHAVIGPPSEPGVLLSAHTDVVAVADQDWSSDPFTLTRVGERLYGRGTTDMKGFIAAVLATVPYAVAEPLARPLHIALSCDEELGCKGVGTLLDFLADNYPPPVLGIVGEPTGMRIANRHKGKVGMRVDVRGRALHSSAAPRGVNAVTQAASLITSIAALADELAAGDELDDAYEIPYSTLSIGPIHGGVSTNIVPEACSFEFELRYLPGQDPEAVIDRIRNRAAEQQESMRSIASEAAIELTQIAGYPPLTPFTGSPALPLPVELGDGRGAVDFGTEAGLFNTRLGAPVLICGPGDMARAHRADEYVEVRELSSAASLLHRLVDDLRAA